MLKIAGHSIIATYNDLGDLSAQFDNENGTVQLYRSFGDRSTADSRKNYSF